MENTKTFYSERSIYIATYLGGPMAAGYLIKQNYQELGNNDLGQKAFIYGIVSTLLLFVMLFSIPEHIIEKVPNVLIPAIYTLIVYFIVEKKQGEQLKAHKETEGAFYSVWKAMGIGLVSAVIYLVVGIAIAFAVGDLSNVDPNFDAELYDEKVAEFVQNEEESIKVFAALDTESSAYLIDEFSKGVQLWKRNKQIAVELDLIPNLPAELSEQNQLLLTYSNLRIQHNELIIKALSEDSDQYDAQIDKVWNKIEAVLEKL